MHILKFPCSPFLEFFPFINWFSAFGMHNSNLICEYWLCLHTLQSLPHSRSSVTYEYCVLISLQNSCWSISWNTRLLASNLEVWQIEAIGVTSTRHFRLCWHARPSTISWRLCHCFQSVLGSQLLPSLTACKHVYLYT